MDYKVNSSHIYSFFLILNLIGNPENSRAYWIPNQVGNEENNNIEEINNNEEITNWEMLVVTITLLSANFA